MEHLSVNDIIKYITANKIDRETLDLMSKVNGHIRICSSCRETLNAFERINEKNKADSLKQLLELDQFNDLTKI